MLCVCVHAMRSSGWWTKYSKHFKVFILFSADTYGREYVRACVHLCVCWLLPLWVCPLWMSTLLILLGGDCCQSATLNWALLRGKKKRCVVCIQVVEVSGVSDEKMNLIAYWSPSGNSHFHGSGGFSVLLDGIHQVFWISACWCSYLSEHKVVYVPPQTFFFFSFIIHCVRLLHPRTWPLKIRQSC